MTRPLEQFSGEELYVALRSALSGTGPAIFAGTGRADLPQQVARRVAVVVQSSGSTDAPKRVALSADALLSNAAATESAIGGPGQWLLALWIPAMTVDRLPGDQLPWIVNIITVATSMGAIALPFLGAWVYLFAMATLSGFVRYLAYGGGDASIAFQDSVMIVLISGFMLGLLQLTLRAGREQDAAALAAQEAAAATAAAETLERQRTRYHAFTHDDVLATLLAASQDGATPSEVTKRSAMRTLEKMDQFRADVPLQHWLTIGELESHLRLAAVGVGVPLHSTLTAPGGTDLRIPVEVCDALTEALTEAMRNSVRHGAWPDAKPVHREARASRTAGTIEIVVADDGRGFNPRRVGIDRLGVRLSILQRVNSQPGGHASIDSARGAGTTVRLTWVASAGDEATE